MKVAVPGRPSAPGAPPSNGASPRRRLSAFTRWRRLPRAIRWLVVGLLVVLIVGLVAQQARPAAAPSSTTPTAVAGGRLIAHGTVAPVSQARVGTLNGGVLLSVSVNVGDSVDAQRELARVRGVSDVEVLTAPFAGTVTGVLAHVGDTLVPGAGVLTIADLGRLQVETTDVDEFLISHVHPGQSVALEIDALNGRELTGRVQTVSLQPQTTSAGDQQYPVTIDLGGTPPDLRPGMSVRISVPD
jgi:multidrug efflux pump subunit AcrA (membrane-fusion protein)